MNGIEYRPYDLYYSSIDTNIHVHDKAVYSVNSFIHPYYFGPFDNLITQHYVASGMMTYEQ